MKSVLKTVGICLSLLAIYHCALGPKDVGGYLLRNKAPSVFRLVTPSNFGHGGTGFSLTMPSGNVFTVTNSHICYAAEDKKLLAVHADGYKEELTVMEISDTTDLCIMSRAMHAPPLEMASYTDHYERINVIGHPKLHPMTWQEGRYVGGQFLVSIPLNIPEEMCVGQKFSMQNVLIFGIFPKRLCMMTVWGQDTTLKTFGGNSGSPIVNDSGDVVGVLFAGDGETQWGLVIPLDSLREFIKVF